MTPLIIELKKPPHGPASLACVRADGTRTWSRLHPFMPTHDLTHCAVESVLGFDQAFFGLIGSGWSIDDFAAPGAARRLPPEAHWAEHLVAIVERGIGHDFATVAEAFFASVPAAVRPPPGLLTEARLGAIEALRRQLLRSWELLPRGETLRVTFPATLDAG